MLGSPLSTFINVQGLLIVVGGTCAATSVAFPTDELKWIWPVSRRVFNDPGNEMVSLSHFIVEAMGVMRRKGRVALETLAEDAPTRPLRKGLMLIADGTDAGTIRSILSTEQRAMEEHHRAGQKIFTEMGKSAPAFGMVGTLIGLVQMLADLNDPENIGPAMAVALLTTFYGALMANAIFIPLAGKLRARSEEELLNYQIIITGVRNMVAGENPRIIEQKLLAFMPPKERESQFD